MALLKSIPLKWKLGLTLFGTVIGAVTVYTLLAKNTFETDKISYALESQQSRLESAKNEIKSKFDKIFLSARSVIATYDYSLGSANTGGNQIFNEEKGLVALELWNETSVESLIRLEKKSSVLPPFQMTQHFPELRQLQLQPLDNDHYLLTLRYPKGAHEVLNLRVVFTSKSILPAVSTTQSIAVAQGKHIMALSDIRGIGTDTFKSIIQSKRTIGDLWSHERQSFLVNETSLGLADLKLYALTPRSEALGILEAFFMRSMVFMMLAACVMALMASLVAQYMQKQSTVKVADIEIDKTPETQPELIVPHQPLPDFQEVITRFNATVDAQIKEPYFEQKHSLQSEEEL